MTKWRTITPIRDIVTLIGKARGKKIPHRFRHALASLLLNELHSDRRAACRMRGQHGEPNCALCGRNHSDGLRHILGMGQPACPVWSRWCEEILEREGTPEPAATANLINPEGDLLQKLRLIYLLHTLYRWRHYYNYALNTHNVNLAWNWVKRGPS